MPVTTVRIGTRGSPLALAQTELVRAALIQAHPGLVVETVRITTKGDLLLDRPLAALGDKGLFVAEIEEALRTGRIDCAVHSSKDLPSDLTDGMTIAAYLERADPRDVLVTRGGEESIDALPQGARVGTGSPRRRCQLLAVRPDLQVLDVRGNVGTRLQKLASGEYDALVLAAAGLDRLGVHNVHGVRLSADVMLPAVGQGAIAIEIRGDRADMTDMLAPLNHKPTYIAVQLERVFLGVVGGGCHAAVAAHAVATESDVTISGMVGSVNGTLLRQHRTAIIDSDLSAAESAVRELSEYLVQHGGELLRDTLIPHPAT